MSVRPAHSHEHTNHNHFAEDALELAFDAGTLFLPKAVGNVSSLLSTGTLGDREFEILNQRNVEDFSKSPAAQRMVKQILQNQEIQTYDIQESAVLPDRGGRNFKFVPPVVGALGFGLVLAKNFKDNKQLREPSNVENLNPDYSSIAPTKSNMGIFERTWFRPVDKQITVINGIPLELTYHNRTGRRARIEITAGPPELVGYSTSNLKGGLKKNWKEPGLKQIENHIRETIPQTPPIAYHYDDKIISPKIKIEPIKIKDCKLSENPKPQLKLTSKFKERAPVMACNALGSQIADGVIDIFTDELSLKNSMKVGKKIAYNTAETTIIQGTTIVAYDTLKDGANKALTSEPVKEATKKAANFVAENVSEKLAPLISLPETLPDLGTVVLVAQSFSIVNSARKEPNYREAGKKMAKDGSDLALSASCSYTGAQIGAALGTLFGGPVGTYGGIIVGAGFGRVMYHTTHYVKDGIVNRYYAPKTSTNPTTE